MPLNVQIAAIGVPPSMKLRYVHSLPTLMPFATSTPLRSRNRNLAVVGHASAEQPLRAAHVIDGFRAVLVLVISCSCSLVEVARPVPSA